MDLAGWTVHGNAVYLLNGDILVDGGTLGGSRVALLLHDAGAELRDVVWVDNDVDLRVEACGVRVVTGYDAAETVLLCPEQDELAVPLVFDFAPFEAIAGDG